MTPPTTHRRTSLLGAATLFGFIIVTGPPASGDERTTDDEDRVACAQERGQPLGTCTVRVTRGEAGEISVTVRFANGFSRSLRFVDGAFVRADATMSGSGTDTDWHLDGGVHRIRVDDQRYEVPDELVSGH